MCNMLHEDSVPIPKDGTGFKIFWEGGKSLVEQNEYRVTSGGLVVFDDALYYDSDKTSTGFCFFLDEETAIRAMTAWGSYFIFMYKINYYGGLGKHVETNFVAHMSFEIALCRSFQRLHDR